MKRNAAVVLGNVGTSEDEHVLERALGDCEPLVREHAASALERMRRRDAAESVEKRVVAGAAPPEPDAIEELRESSRR